MADGTKITISEALEATAFAVGRKPVERSDAAAIQAAEARATGLDANIPGGLAAQAQSAAAANAWTARDEDKTKLGDVDPLECYGETDCGQGGGERRRGKGSQRGDAKQAQRNGEGGRCGRVHVCGRAVQPRSYISRPASFVRVRVLVVDRLVHGV